MWSHDPLCGRQVGTLGGPTQHAQCLHAKLVPKRNICVQPARESCTVYTKANKGAVVETHPAGLYPANTMKYTHARTHTHARPPSRMYTHTHDTQLKLVPTTLQVRSSHFATSTHLSPIISVLLGSSWVLPEEEQCHMHVMWCCRGSQLCQYSTRKQLTKTLGSKRPTVDWLIVVYCSLVNFATISCDLWANSGTVAVHRLATVLN